MLTAIFNPWGFGLDQAHSASFDCQKASTSLEKLICSDDSLSELDGQLAQKYFEAKSAKEIDPDFLLQNQRAWLKTRITRCSPNAKDETPSEDSKERYITCLKDLYERRIKWLDFPELWPPTTDERMDRAIERLRTLTPDDLYSIAASEPGDALHKISCRFFEKDPKAAQRVFGASFYSTKDTRIPLCQELDITTRVPETKILLEALSPISGANGACRGTMEQGYWRQEMTVRIVASVDPQPQTGDHLGTSMTGHERSGYRADLKHWSQQGNWEKRQYAVLQSSLIVVNAALQKYYRNKFHIEDEQAKKAAEYYSDRLIDIYGGRSGDSSTLSYPSLCFETTDLDAYLKTGNPPSHDCPYSEYADMSRETTLRRLLGLAIVNDYPLRDIKKLIADKAQLDIAKSNRNQERVRETPLMMAAPRPDVIDVLLKAGADPNAQNGFGKTALMYAVQERNINSVKKLIQAGANVNAKTSEETECTGLNAGNRSVLMYAAWQSTPEIIKTLLNLKADAGAKDTNGDKASNYLTQNETLSKPDQEAIQPLLRQ